MQRQGNSHLQEVQEEGTPCKGLKKWKDAKKWNWGASTGRKQGSGFFGFGSFEQPFDVDSLGFLLDSGCNGFMLKDRALFRDLDQSFSDKVQMEAKQQSKDMARHGAGCWKQGHQCELELKPVFWVPNYTRNLI